MSSFLAQVLSSPLDPSQQFAPPLDTLSPLWDTRNSVKESSEILAHAVHHAMAGLLFQPHDPHWAPNSLPWLHLGTNSLRFERWEWERASSASLSLTLTSLKILKIFGIISMPSGLWILISKAKFLNLKTPYLSQALGFLEFENS